MNESAVILDASALLRTEEIKKKFIFDVPVSLTDEKFHGVVFEGDFRSIAGAMTLKATITGVYDAVCDRCLEPFAICLAAVIDTVITEDGSKDDSVSVEGGKIDLVKTCYDALSLELPTVLLCREDCKGLCPVCGTDLNVSDCGCNK